MKTWAEHKANLARSVSLLPLGVTVPKPGIMPLENMWRRAFDLTGWNPENHSSYPVDFNAVELI